ncbi:MAG: MliC family protein [Desulfobacterium sp.]|nr:MliC family protein [Desulfobacterium sp.]
MRIQKAVAGSVMILALFAAGCVTMMSSGLTVAGGDTVIYRCEKGDLITAKYYRLSDHSLNFVKVTMPDGQEYTLPQVVSASGARYTDEHQLVWWIKGDVALVETLDENGKWQMKYQHCETISDTE